VLRRPAADSGRSRSQLRIQESRDDLPVSYRSEVQKQVNTQLHSGLALCFSLPYAKGRTTPPLSSETTLQSEAPPIEPVNSCWFSSEVHVHDATLKGYLRRSFPSIRDVDDVVQESYLRVWRRQITRPIEQVSGSVRASVKAFLFQVARRLALDTIRHERASPIETVTEIERSSVMDVGRGIHEIVCTNEEFQLLLEAIETLPARCRAVVVLRKIHGYSPPEAARKLGISEETVHVQTRRGLLRVQEFLRERSVIR
jgi:RNA polymerase sigma-70 factor (ECF subfamily)